jgi:hypothetical protein
MKMAKKFVWSKKQEAYAQAWRGIKGYSKEAISARSKIAKLMGRPRIVNVRKKTKR